MEIHNEDFLEEVGRKGGKGGKREEMKRKGERRRGERKKEEKRGEEAFGN